MSSTFKADYLNVDKEAQDRKIRFKMRDIRSA